MSGGKGSRKIGIPSSGNGGLEDTCDLHFGRCRAITVLELDGDDLKAVEVVRNPGHKSGDCIKLIGILDAKDVTTLLVGGIGRTAFKVCNDLGMTIYGGLRKVSIKDSLQDFLDDKLLPLTAEKICGPSIERDG